MPVDEANPEGKSRIEQMAAACIHRIYAQMDKEPDYLQYGARAGIAISWTACRCTRLAIAELPSRINSISALVSSR